MNEMFGRYQKLESSVKDNIKEAVEMMRMEAKLRSIIRKRGATDDEEEDPDSSSSFLCRPSRMKVSLPNSASSTQESPDVAVSITNF